MSRKNKIKQNFIVYSERIEEKPYYQVTCNEYGIFLGKHTKNGYQSLGKLKVNDLEGWGYENV